MNSSPERPLSWPLRIAAHAALAVGILGIGAFFLGGASSCIPYPQSMWLPLAEPGAVAIDSQQRIVVGVDFYQRIQVYRMSGEFESGWKVPAHGGLMFVEARAGEIVVIPARGNTKFFYAEDGALLREQAKDGSEPVEAAGGAATGDAEQSTIEIHYAHVFPMLVRVLPDGRSEIVRREWPIFWFAMGPLPAWICGLAGILSYRLLTNWPYLLLTPAAEQDQTSTSEEPRAI